MSSENIDQYADRMMPLIEKCIKKAFHGELDPEDILQFIRDGRAFSLSGITNETINIVTVFELLQYPRFTSANCMLVASDTPGIMRTVNRDFMPQVREYLKTCGASHIECYTSDAMRKIAERMGLIKIYNFFRAEI